MEKLLLQFTFFFIIILIFRKGFDNFIFLPLLYYILSSLPLFYVTFNDPSWNFYTNHLLINNTIILFSFIFGNYLHKFIGTVLIFPSTISFLKKEFSLKFTYTLITVIFFFELFFVVFYHKPFFVTSLINLSLLEDRVSTFSVHYLIDLWFANYHSFLLTFIIFIFGLILMKDKKKFKDIAILSILIVMYLGMLKKSAIVIIGLGYIMIHYNIKKKFLTLNFSQISLIIFIVLIFHYVLISYYGHLDQVYSHILNRIFFEAIADTKNFYEIFNNITPSLNYLPSEGGFLYGFEKIPLEKSIFQEVYSNRIERYGNSPVLSITYGILILGSLTYYYLFFLYTLFFACGRFLDKYLISNSLSKRAFVISLSLFYMPIFLSGAFKVFSIFIIYPISLLLIFVAYKLLPNNGIIK